MSRFLLIDHALVDVAGHHYEYARRVLEAAGDAGHEPVLGANRRFTAATNLPFPCHAVYEHGFWIHQRLPRLYGRVRNAAAAIRRLTRFPRRRHSKRRETSKPTSQAQTSRSLAGAVAQAGYDRLRQRGFVRDTLRLLSQTGIDEGDLIFLPSMSAVEMVALRTLLTCHPEWMAAHWHCLFRREPALIETRGPTEHSSGKFRPRTFSWTAQHRQSAGVHLYTDSEALTEFYQQATDCRFQTLPIPSLRCESFGRRTAPSALRVVCLGDARAEKGFHHLPELIARSLAGKATNRPLSFIVQMHCSVPLVDSRVAAARDRLRHTALPEVELVDGALDSSRYLELLTGADLILLPYDASAYAARSSGVFVEALAAGIPVIVPADTWMSRQLPAGAGLAFHDVDELPNMLRTVAGSYTQYRATAEKHAVAWREHHSAASLMRMLNSASAATATVHARPHFPASADQLADSSLVIKGGAP